MAGPGNKTPKPRSNPIPLDQLDFARSRVIVEKLFGDEPLGNIEELMQLYGVKQKGMAMGGPTKKKKKMAMGGTLKNVPSSNKGLGKLPTPVRNKMDYKAYGGKAMKTYAKGGGMRKARTYG